MVFFDKLRVSQKEFLEVDYDLPKDRPTWQILKFVDYDRTYNETTGFSRFHCINIAYVSFLVLIGNSSLPFYAVGASAIPEFRIMYLHHFNDVTVNGHRYDVFAGVTKRHWRYLPAIDKWIEQK